MAEDKFNSNARSPRFSTTKALGFKGGSTNPQTGNLQQPTFLQTAGVNRAPQKPTEPAAKAAERDINPALSQFSAPNPPGLVKTLATGAAGVAAGEGVKYGVKKAGNAISNYWDSIGTGAAPGSLEVANAPGVEDPMGEFIGANAKNWDLDPATAGFAYGAADGTLAAANLVGDSGGDALGSFIAGNTDNWGLAAGTEAAGGSVPWVGPAVRLAQGDVKGAAGSAIGGTVGSAFGPIGTAVGSWLGSTIGGACFITEAVMSSGGADNGMELEALRGFRDNILSATPQGQAMIAEYEAIAPVVVEAVSQRPDGLQIFQQIKGEFIDPAVEAVQAGDFQSALQIYAQMISFVTPFAAEAAEAGMGGQDPGAMNQMGDHAAMVGHSPEMAAAAMPGDQEWDPGVDDGMPSGQEYMPAGGQQGAMGMPQPPGGGMMQPGAPPAIGQTFAQRRY
uniref:Uncharacterized protein n=1 Tax=viral metagenome TaxID=1070528 RepID=A0A6M3IQY1_9ZZZZ